MRLLSVLRSRGFCNGPNSLWVRLILEVLVGPVVYLLCWIKAINVKGLYACQAEVVRNLSLFQIVLRKLDSRPLGCFRRCSLNHQKCRKN